VPRPLCASVVLTANSGLLPGRICVHVALVITEARSLPLLIDTVFLKPSYLEAEDSRLFWVLGAQEAEIRRIGI
jgi:hypothetical protein